MGLQVHTGPLRSAAASWPSPTTSEPVFSAVQHEGVQCEGVCEVLLCKCLSQGPVLGCRAAVCREGRAVGARPHGLLTWCERHPGCTRLRYNSRFQNHRADTWKTGLSRPLVVGISRALSQPNTRLSKVWLQERRSHRTLLILAAEDLAAAPHTGNFLDSEALETQG